MIKQKKIPFWHDPKYRAYLFQLLLVAWIVSWGVYLVSNTLHNLETRGIHTGFAFLDIKAGFDILQTLIAYDSDSTYGRTFIVGLLNTVLVSIVSIIFATILGFIIGIARLSNNWIVAKISLIYVEIFRNIPLLLQILFWYHILKNSLPAVKNSINISDIIFISNRGFYMPKPIYESGFVWVALVFVLTIIASFFIKKWVKTNQEKTGNQNKSFLINIALILGFTGLAFLFTDTPLHFEVPEKGKFNFIGGMVFIPELAAMILALSIYTAAFIAEIVRSGILSVAQGQKEAAKALGLKQNKVLSLIVIPQAMRVITPQTITQYINIIKNSSLSTAIGYPDLVGVFMGTTLNQTGQAVEIVAMTMAVYLSLNLVISFFMNHHSNRSKIKGKL